MQGFQRPRLAVAAVAASAASLGGLAVAAPAHAAGATTISVDPAGSTKTISAGLAAAHSGDTVSVAANTYSENVVVPAGVHLVSAAAGAAHINGSVTVKNARGASVEGFAITTGGTGAAITVTSSDDAVIKNNTITNSGLASTSPSAVATPGSDGIAALLLSSAGSVKVTGNHVDGNVYHGIFVTGGGNGPTITGNEVSKNKDPNYRFAAGISVKATGVTVSGNVSHDNDDSGIQLYVGGDNGLVMDNVVYNNGDHGIDNLAVTGGKILNNTVYNNATAGINVEGTSSKYTIENNISMDNGGGGTGRSKGDIRVAQDATVDAVVDHNLVRNTNADTAHAGKTLPVYDWDSKGITGAAATAGSNVFYPDSGTFHTGTSQGANDKTGDPAFNGVASGDFHIGAASPAANLADKNIVPTGMVDYDGNVWTGSTGAFNAGSTGLTNPPPSGGTTPPPSTGSSTPAVGRVAGADRYGTGIALSKLAFPSPGSAPAVVLATGDDYPDALAGVPLAKKLGAPLLLVPTAGANQAVTDEVNRVLKSGGTIYVLGGQKALPDANVAGMTGTKVRYFGADRYGTAIQIAQAGLGSPKNVVLATGSNFADALAAGPYAADVFGGGNAAILLTAGTVLAPGDATYLAGATSVSAVGGPAVAAAASGNITVTENIKGLDRYDTAAQIAAKFTTEKTAGVAVSGASNPKQFADALTGAAYLANNGAPLVLVDNNSVPQVSITALNGISKAIGTTGTISIFGGPVAISEYVKGTVVSAVGGHAA